MAIRSVLSDVRKYSNEEKVKVNLIPDWHVFLDTRQQRCPLHTVF